MSPRNKKQDSEISTEVVPSDAAEVKLTVVETSAAIIAQQQHIIQFRNRPMIQMRNPYPHFVPMTKEIFKRVAYPNLGGVSRTRINDIFDFVENTASDFTIDENLILFGVEDPSDGSYDGLGFYHERAETRVWDMRQMDFVDVDPSRCVWRSPYGGVKPTGRIPFIMQLAGNDEGLYDDIMQSLAPMVMQRKPDGVIWWVGDGANGKSTLMDAIYKIFPGQLASLTVKVLTDGRDASRLNGTLANIVKESSEGRVEDTEIYKAVGTHEDFSIHKFHSQDMTMVRGNLHHIFSANNIPTFNDKGYSARRRTYIVPFTQTFESDPTFEERTFTSEMFGCLIAEMCRYAQRLRDQGYRYKWSATTLAAKLEYDTDANNAEEYAKHIINEGVVAFESFNPMRMDYENWCADNGFVPLGITNLRRALGALGFERISYKIGEHVRKMYRLPVAVSPGELQPIGLKQPGMYTIPGFQRRPESAEVKVPDFDKPADDEPPVTTTTTTSILKGRW